MSSRSSFARPLGHVGLRTTHVAIAASLVGVLSGCDGGSRAHLLGHDGSAVLPDDSGSIDGPVGSATDNRVSEEDVVVQDRDAGMGELAAEDGAVGSPADGAGDSALTGQDDATREGRSDAPADGLGDASGDSSADGGICPTIDSEYQSALLIAKECSVGAAQQCEVQAKGDFWCGCLVYVNKDGDALKRIYDGYMTSGCRLRCTGVCVSLRPTNCVKDDTSSTGGRCKIADLWYVQNIDDGGSLTVPVFSNIDIYLTGIGTGSYSTTPQLSSNSLSIVEITIPAQADTATLTRVYRLKAVSAGVVHIQIPFDPGTGEPAQNPFTFTVTVD